jgi:Holliday junction resolvase RusA-like endonuclease
MKLTVNMPWEKDLSVNTMRFGAGGGYRKKPHVQTWMHNCAFFVGGSAFLWDFDDALIHARKIRVTVDFRFPDKRRRDDHNYYKVICDAVAAGLGMDDKDIRIRTGTVTVDRENPGFRIEVSDEKTA